MRTPGHLEVPHIPGATEGLQLSIVTVLGQERAQQLIAHGVVIDPPLRQHHAGLIDECHVVVIFSPVDPTEPLRKQHPP